MAAADVGIGHSGQPTSGALMRRTIQSAFALSLVVGAAPAWSAGSDELWEITQKMAMPGMNMPGIKITSCIARNGNYKPGDDPNAKNCTVDDYKVSGNTVTWKMRCTGKNAMTGSGEMTKTADTMKGVFRMSASGMDMTQTMDGKRVGTCDAGEEQKKMDKTVADFKARSDDAVKQMCEGSVKREAESGGMGNGASTFQSKGQCLGYKPQLCEQTRSQVGSYGGYAHYIRWRETAKTTNQPWGWVLAECGIDLEKQRLTLCGQAVTDKKYRFIGTFCPDEAKQMYAKNCAGFGMDYTADMAKPNANMCYALRSKSRDYNDQDAGDGNAARAARTAGSEKAATDEGKGADNAAKPAESATSKLKKLFGF
jgi:hypothetical protein